MFECKPSSVTKAVNDIQVNTAKSVEKIQRDVLAAQRAAAEKAERDRQVKAEAERQRVAAQRAAIDAANQAAAAKEVAWSRLYRQSKQCEPYDAPATMECANEHARAKKAFEERWAAGRL